MPSNEMTHFMQSYGAEQSKNCYKKSEGSYSTLVRFFAMKNGVLLQKIKDFDHVIIDTSAGAHCNVINALLGSELSLLVTEPTPLGAHDLKIMINIVERLKIPYHVVLNKAGINSSEEIKSLCAKSGKKIFEIPYDDNIASSYSKGEPVTHESISSMIEVLGL
mgnify:CR=1 FL=1